MSWRRNRGWVFGYYLEAQWRGLRVVFDDDRTFVDIAFVSLSFGYWDRHDREQTRNDRYDGNRDRSVSREGRNERDDMPVMRCGTAFADPS